MNAKGPTIQDVAVAANVSTATISRALSNPHLVSEKTRTAVLKAVEQTGYRINRAAQNLRKRQAGAILVLLPNLGNPFFSQILSGIESVLATSDLSVLIADTSGIKQDQLTSYFRDTRADGIILLDGGIPRDVLKELAETAPDNRIVFACEWKPGVELPSIRSDNRGGALQAVSHLVELGHQKIGHVAGPRNNVLTKERLLGFQNAMFDHGLDIEPDWVVDGGDFSLDAGAQAARQFVEMDNRPTAVFCGSDLIAMGFISELNKRGVSVPADMSVVGFDDIEIADRFIPSLTTVRQNRTQLGVLAATTLLGHLSGRDNLTSDNLQLVDVLLINRDSTAALAEK
ncbi:LacI family DNA-binding transcriptional regulator [Maritalea sp.]|uniref:LacI family DNA-binding transcriptional regulator n=1 Tax=Maritalea sp. TaxID=2003361 RepID=UPI003EF439D2